MSTPMGYMNDKHTMKQKVSDSVWFLHLERQALKIYFAHT